MSWRWFCAGLGVGLGDLWGSLQLCFILWFCKAGYPCCCARGRQAEEPLAHLYLPKVIYTMFTCYLHGDLQVGMKTNCGSSFSSCICRQLFPPPGNLAATFVPAVTWEDTCSWVSTLYQNRLVWIHTCRRVMGKLHYCRVFYLNAI